MENLANPDSWTHLPPPLIKDFETDINGDPFKYRENNKLKSRDTVLPFTKEHVDELIRCSRNLKYFANNYFMVVHQDHGLIKMELRDYQQNCLDSFEKNRFNILKFPRQSGKTTIFTAFVCHFILFNTYKNVVILANKEKTAKGLLHRIKLAYQELPYWLQQGIVTWNKLEIELENGCKVTAAATSTDAARSESVALLIVDEVSHIDATMWDEFYESVYPTIASAKTSKVILVSTPKGMNHFYKLWTDAHRKNNDYVPIEITWDQVPGYDEAFKKQTIGNIGRRKWNQEFGCKFLASANSLVDVEVIEAIPFMDPIDPKTIGVVYDKIMYINENFGDLLKIFKLPVMDHTYGIGVDSAKITEESAGDSLAVQIIDTTDLPFEQVLSMDIPNEIHYLEVPEMVNILANFYNGAWLFIENNDSVGQQIADTLLFEYEYEFIYSEKPGISGFRTTKKNKKIGCLNLKMLIEKNQLILHDFDTISQLSTFIKHKTSYAAEPGYKDDAIMSLIHTLVFMQDRIFFEQKADLLKKMLHGNRAAPPHLRKEPEQQIDEEPMPFTSNMEELAEENRIF